MTNRYYLTTAIAYPNGSPHIGHAYEAIASDAICRFMRADGKDVYFVSGADEHGQKIAKTADAEGITPQELVDRNVPLFLEMLEACECDVDYYVRTSTDYHHACSREIWRRMANNGDIYKGSYSGWYSVTEETFVPESEIELLPDGSRVSKISGAELQLLNEESYFFRLSNYQTRLLQFHHDNPEFVGPTSSRHEVLSFIGQGLEDLSISRKSLDWGVRVPDDDEHVMYVWIDALTAYITATGNLCDDYSLDGAAPEGKRQFWPASTHIIGKDIVRFHAIFWPAFLMSADLPMPERVFSHGLLLNKGTKMSKSLGNVISPIDMIDEYGIDAVRYFLLRDTPFGQDGAYGHEAIVGRYNSDLANDLGNLAQRSISMVASKLDGSLVEQPELNDEEVELLESCTNCLVKIRVAMKSLALHEALTLIWALVARGNRYFAASKPWELVKSDPDRAQAVLWTTLELVRRTAILCSPFIPHGANELLNALNVPEHDRTLRHLDVAVQYKSIEKPTAVFPRYLDKSNDK